MRGTSNGFQMTLEGTSAFAVTTPQFLYAGASSKLNAMSDAAGLASSTALGRATRASEGSGPKMSQVPGDEFLPRKEKSPMTLTFTDDYRNACQF